MKNSDGVGLGGGFTFVIPTIWAAGEAFVETLVADLDASDWVSQILLIDNAPKGKTTPFRFSKLSHIPQRMNLYVNPSWNLGVNLAETGLVALCNDDINMNWGVLQRVSEVLSLDSGNRGKTLEDSGFSAVHSAVGAVGLGSPQATTAAGPTFSEVESRPLGFGMCMMMGRESYVDIPNELKVWCGDDFLFDMWQARNQKILALNEWPFVLAGNKVSVSSGKRRFTGIKRRDVKTYESKRLEWISEIAGGNCGKKFDNPTSSP